MKSWVMKYDILELWREMPILLKRRKGGPETIMYVTNIYKPHHIVYAGGNG